MNKRHILIILFFILIFYYTQIIMSGSVLVGDDLYTFFADGIKLDKQLDYGSWVMYLMNLLLYYIPNKLNINLQDWCISYGSLIKTITVTGIFVYIYKFIRKSNQSVISSLLGTFILYAIFFILHSRMFFVDFMINEGFFRFIIPAFLTEVCLYYLYSLIRGERVNNKLLTILSVITAASSEVAAVILISTILIISIYKKEKRYIKLMLMMIIGFIMLLSTKGFQEHINGKLTNEELQFQYIGEFLLMFIKNVIWDYIVIYIIIALLYVREKKEGFFSVIIIAGAFIFFISLFFMGKTSYNGTFWLDHNDIYSFLIIILIVAIAVLFNKVDIKICILSVLILAYPFYDSSLLLKNTLLNIKDNTYARDKIRLFYEYRNETAKMPELVKFRMFYSVMTKERMDVNDCHPIKDVSTKAEEDKLQMLLNMFYYPIMYKSGINTKQEIIKDGVEYYKKRGGSLREVELGEYKFSDLENREFVLKKGKTDKKK